MKLSTLVMLSAVLAFFTTATTLAQPRPRWKGTGRLGLCELRELFVNPGGDGTAGSPKVVWSVRPFKKGDRITFQFSYFCREEVTLVGIGIRDTATNGDHRQFVRTLKRGEHSDFTPTIKAGPGGDYEITFRTTDGGEMAGRVGTLPVQWQSIRARFH